MKHPFSVAWLLLALFLQAPAFADETRSTSEATKKSAHEVYQLMLESSLFDRDIPIPIAGYTDRFATYGAEKEGSSSILTRVMGPNKAEFQRLLSTLPVEKRTEFQREFMQGWVSGKYRARNVTDATGTLKDFDFSEFKRQDWAQMNPEELNTKFTAWLEKAGDRSFSYLTSATRRKFYNGELPGLEAWKGQKKNRIFTYNNFVTNFGEAEKYIRDAHRTGPGWEINFVPQKSYGEHDRMVRWFRETMGTNGSLFEAPGHQWNVFTIPKEISEDPAKLAQFRAKMGELLRGMQAYITLKGLGGRSGMEFSNYKAIHTDSSFTDPFNLGRGVVRTATKSEFGAGTFGVELRSGTKSDETRRFMQQILTSRVVTGDFSGISDLANWDLHPSSKNLSSPASYAERFGVSEDIAKKFIAAIDKTKKFVRDGERAVALGYVAPLWNWENAPYLSAEKKGQLRALTKSFIESIARKESLTPDEMQNLVQDWVKSSRVEVDLANYLQPRAPPVKTEVLLQYAHPTRPPTPNHVDVNKIDLGIEYTGRFQIKPRVIATEQELDNGKRAWLSTLYDVTPAEREQAMKQVAEELAKTFRVGAEAITKVDGGHGHGLGTAFLVKDDKGRSWRIEWDGVTREYDLEGRVIPESVRGGHVELVTPKLNLTGEEVDRVFHAFNAQGMIPDPLSGGGHINIDLAPFKGKPRQFARFLALFLENRGTMALMFQHVDRLKSAEPLDISSRLISQLKDFRGSEEDLKKLLYNERWFNQRVGRKSRYTQIDIGSYFQDVIPDHLISKDFDLFKDVWRKNFRVEPKIRKAEFRMFNAPRNARESALQTRLVRALLDKALNEDAPISGAVQNVDHVAYVKNPSSAERDFKKTMAQLGLDEKEYREYMLDGMNTTRQRLQSITYQSLSQRLTNHREVDGWGQAVDARPAERALSSEARVWDGNNPDPEALRYHEMRQRARQRREELARLSTSEPNGRLYRTIQDKLGVETWRELPQERILPFVYSYATKGTGVDRTQANTVLSELRLKDEFKDMLIGAIKSANTAEYAHFLKGEVLTIAHSPDVFSAALESKHIALKEAAVESLEKLPPEQKIGQLLEFYEKALRGSTDGDLIAALDKGFERIIPVPTPDDFMDIRVELLERIALEEKQNQDTLKIVFNQLNKLSRQKKNSAIAAQARMVLVNLLDRNNNESVRRIAYELFSATDLSNKLEEFEFSGRYTRHQNKDIAKAALDLRSEIIRNYIYSGSEELKKGLELLKKAPADEKFFYYNEIVASARPDSPENKELLKLFTTDDPVKLAKESADPKAMDLLKSLINRLSYSYDTISPEYRQYYHKLYSKLLDSKEGASILDRVLTRQIPSFTEAALPDLLKFLKQHHKNPSQELLAELHSLMTPMLGDESKKALRNNIIGTLMQWPEGARLVKNTSTSSEPLQRIIGQEKCQAYFRRIGI
jgi:hypothetical protein